MARDRRGYYYRSHKVGGRVLREYVGGGALAELAARSDARRRRDRAAARDARAAERAELEARDARVAELNEVADALAAVLMAAAGYRRHHRGEWRMQRGQDCASR